MIRPSSLPGWCAVFAIGVAALAAYVSLVPFRFATPTDEVALLEHVWQSFELGTASRGDATVLRSRGNLLANVVLFLPFGFFGVGALVDERSTWTRWALVIAAVGASSLVVSGTIEAAQAFLPGRTPSVADIAAQATGTAIGIVGWLLLAREVRRWSARFSAGHVSLVFQLLGIYTGIRLLFLVLPLDVTVDLGLLAQRFDRGEIVVNPFTSSSLAWDGLPAMIADLVMAAPVGVFAVMIGVRYGWRRTAASGLLLGGLAFAVGEFVQVFVQSRTADIVDLMMAVAGVAGGVGVANRVAQAAVRDQPEGPVARPAIIAGLIAVGVLYMIYNWTPFDFVLSRSLVAERVGVLLAVPFAGYYQNPEFKALGDLTVKLSLTVPLGVLLQLALGPGRQSYQRSLTVVVIGALVLFFAAVEAGQLLLPSRYPDNTDVLIAVTGVWFGMRLTRRFSGPSRG